MNNFSLKSKSNLIGIFENFLKHFYAFLETLGKNFKIPLDFEYVFLNSPPHIFRGILEWGILEYESLKEDFFQNSGGFVYTSLNQPHNLSSRVFRRCISEPVLSLYLKRT